MTAAKMGLNQELTDRPVTHAVLTTTRDWLSDAALRDAWEEFARRVRKGVSRDVRYAWFREWTTGRNDGIRRTHYHSTWALQDDEQAQRVAEISREVMSARAGAWSPDAHGWKRVWDAGGLTRYIAGLVGHHLKEGQAPDAHWRGRRFATSRGFYAIDSVELDRRAKAIVRDERLAHHLERELASDLEASGAPDGLPEVIWDALLTQRLREAQTRPAIRIVPVARGTWNR